MVNDKVKILIAEDEQIIAMDYKNILQSMGYKVTAVVSRGEDIIEEIYREVPTLIIADINLKGELDGIEAMARVQENYDIPFAYITAFKDFERIVEIYNLKPCDYVLKPVDSAHLEKIVRSCLRQIEEKSPEK